MSERKIPVPSARPKTPYRYKEGALTDSIKNFVKGHEEYVPYFYKDSNNNITIGSGHRVADADYAATLPLYWYESRDKYLREATATEKKTAFEQLRNSALSGNIFAENYDPEEEKGKKEKFLKIGIKSDDDDFILQSTLRRNIGSLENKFADFPNYSTPARTALIDMEYNLGRSGFGERKWPSLYKAVREKDWRTAAKESERNIGENDTRNSETYRLFMDADILEKRKKR